MKDVKQQSTIGELPGTNPMNLTCQPVTGEPEANAATKYAVVINVDGQANPPNNSWTTTVFQSTEEYVIQSQDGTINFDIPPGGLGIFSK